MGMNRLNRHVLARLGKKEKLTAGKANRGDAKIRTPSERNGSLLGLEEVAPAPAPAPKAKKKTTKKKSTKK